MPRLLLLYINFIIFSIDFSLFIHKLCQVYFQFLNVVAFLEDWAHWSAANSIYMAIFLSHCMASLKNTSLIFTIRRISIQWIMTLTNILIIGIVVMTNWHINIIPIRYHT